MPPKKCRRGVHLEKLNTVHPKIRSRGGCDDSDDDRDDSFQPEAFEESESDGEPESSCCATTHGIQAR